MPDFILRYLFILDGRDDYVPVVPDDSLKKRIADAGTRLPPLVRKTLDDRLLGIFFVKNFLGSGLTEWAADDNGKLFSFMVFNSDVLSGDISSILTYKEKTCFKPSEGFDLVFDCGHDLDGLYYIFLHESIHVADYALGITPFTEPSVKKFRRDGDLRSHFSERAWADYGTPRKPFIFHERVTFYGMSDGPRLSLAEAPAVYAALENSGMVTLYGTLNWAEDISEYLTFYHLSEKLKTKVEIRITKNGSTIYRFEPMKQTAVRSRMNEMDIFYPTDRKKPYKDYTYESSRL